MPESRVGHFFTNMINAQQYFSSQRSENGNEDISISRAGLKLWEHFQLTTLPPDCRRYLLLPQRRYNALGPSRNTERQPGSEQKQRRSAVSMVRARDIIDLNFMIYRIDNDLQPILSGEYWELRQSHGLELSKCWASLRRCKISTGPHATVRAAIRAATFGESNSRERFEISCQPPSAERSGSQRVIVKRGCGSDAGKPRPLDLTVQRLSDSERYFS